MESLGERDAMHTICVCVCTVQEIEKKEINICMSRAISDPIYRHMFTHQVFDATMQKWKLKVFSFAAQRNKKVHDGLAKNRNSSGEQIFENILPPLSYIQYREKLIQQVCN